MQHYLPNSKGFEASAAAGYLSDPWYVLVILVVDVGCVMCNECVGAPHFFPDSLER